MGGKTTRSVPVVYICIQHGRIYGVLKAEQLFSDPERRMI